MIYVRTMRRIAEGIALINGVLFTRAKVRKAWRCEICANTIAKGSAAFRALKERGGIFRYARVCVECTESINAEPFKEAIG
jgi:hypothetical protein